MSIIRVENVSVTVNGSNQVYPNTISIICGIGKGFNTCSMSSSDEIQMLVNDTFTVSINDDNFSFIVDKKDYSKDGKLTIYGSGLPSTLTDGAISNTEYVYENSNELIEASAGTIDYINNLPLIEFKGKTYAKDSTAMSRILDMVNIVGGDAYEYADKLYLDVAATIQQNPTIKHTFSDNEYFNFAYSDKRASSSILKQVLFNPIVDDIYSEQSISLDFNEDTNKGEVFFNPSLTNQISSYTINGIEHRTPTISIKNEKITVDNVSFFKTIGGVDEVVYIKLNGEPITDFITYPTHNVIRFSENKTGEVEISYKTKTIIVFAYKTLTFSITYGCSQCSDTIEIDADNVVDSGKCYAKINRPLTYEKGGTVYLSSGANSSFIFVERKGAVNLVQYGTLTLSGGGELIIKYIYDTDDWTDTDFMGNITSTTEDKIETTSDTVIYDDDLGKYIIYLDKPISSINDIYFGSVVIDSSTYSYNDSGVIPYIEFTDNSQNNRTLDISMNVTLDIVTIPAPQSGHPVSLLDVVTCDGVATEQFVPDENTLCNLPATFKIDVASLFDVEISDIFGATLTGDFGDLIIDNFGKVEVSVTTANKYTINASSVKENATITVDANGVI